MDADFGKASRIENDFLGGGGVLTDKSSRDDLLRFKLGEDPRSLLSSSASPSPTRRGEEERVDGGDERGGRGVDLVGREPYVCLTREDMDAEGNTRGRQRAKHKAVYHAINT